MARSSRMKHRSPQTENTARFRSDRTARGSTTKNELFLDFLQQASALAWGIASSRPSSLHIEMGWDWVWRSDNRLWTPIGDTSGQSPVRPLLRGEVGGSENEVGECVDGAE